MNLCSFAYKKIVKMMHSFKGYSPFLNHIIKIAPVNGKDNK